MTAAILYGKEDVRIERIPVPAAGAGEVVVRVGAALTCGTDLKVYRRGYHARMLQPPIPFGHEVAGVIAKVGAGVTSFSEGDRVVALNSAPCGVCFYCGKNQENLCEDLLFNNGAYAEYIRIPARIVEKNMLHVPEDLSLEQAALTEPLACVVLGLEETGAKAGDQIVIIGAGPIGLLFMRTAQLAGMDVIAVVKRAEQVESAKRFGASQVVQTTHGVDTVAAVRQLTREQRGADVVIEAVAKPLAWQWAVDMVRKGGVVNFFGGCAAGTRVDLDTNRLHYNNITMRATFHHTPAACRTAFGYIQRPEFRAEDFITGRAPLVELESVLHRLMNRGDEIKTAILP